MSKRKSINCDCSVRLVARSSGAEGPRKTGGRRRPYRNFRALRKAVPCPPDPGQTNLRFDFRYLFNLLRYLFKWHDYIGCLNATPVWDFVNTGRRVTFDRGSPASEGPGASRGHRHYPASPRIIFSPPLMANPLHLLEIPGAAPEEKKGFRVFHKG